MKKSVANNYIYNLIYRILVLILPLVTIPYLSRVLGAEGVGIYSYTISIVTYFTLFGSLGIDMYAKREIAYVQNDTEKRSKIFFEVFSLRTITLFLSMLIFYFCFAKSIYYKILLLDIIAVAFDISAFFQGMEEFKKIIKRNLIIRCLSIICIFLFVKQPTDLNKYLAIYVLSNFIGNISLWFYLPKYIKKVNIRTLNLLQHLKPTITLFIPQIAVQIYTVLDKTMIGSLIADKAEVGYYEQAQKITTVLLTTITSLGTVMLPRIANKFANGKKEEIKNDILTSFNFVYFLSAPMVFGLIAVAKDLIPWFLGEGFEKSIYIIYGISPIIMLIGLSNVIGVQYLLPTKQQKQYTVSTVVGAITNLVLNFVFIPKFFSVGAAITTVIAETVVTGVQFYCVRKEFDVKKILLMSLKYIISAFVMFVVLVVLNNYLLYNIASLTKMILDVIIGACLYFIILLIIKDEFIKKILNKGLEFIKKNKIKYIYN